VSEPALAGADPQAPGDSAAEPRAGLPRHLVILMGARLALALVSLGIAVALDAVGVGYRFSQPRGLWGTVGFAFLATAIYGLVLPRVRNGARFAAFNVATDVAIVSGLVGFSGGVDSVFAFLFVLVAVYGALLFERRGALATAALAVFAHGLVLLAAETGWLPAAPLGAPGPRPLVLAVWGVNAGAVLLVAVLASLLGTELRRTGEALRERTRDLTRLARLHQHTVESLMSGLLTTDRAGRITSFNPEAERITGRPASAAIGRDVDSVLPGIRELAMARANEGGAAHSRVRTAYTSERGERMHLGLGAYVLKEAEGVSSGHVVIFQDVTEVVAMERELRRSERLAAIGQLSASIAHEIRNPLAAISGSIQVLEHRTPALANDPEASRLMEIVLRETDRLNALITDFLQYARPAPRNLAEIALGEAVDGMLRMFESVRPEGVRVSTRLEPGLGLRADPEQLRQVLWNLVLNAAQAMEKGGQLEIRTAGLNGAPQEPLPGRRNEEQAQQDWVEIAVVDEGVGIPMDALDRIFDPFFTTKRGGSGLGLATVHRIVEQHGGSIRVESALGIGTTIRVRLPRAGAPA
jgi:two-component system sensor histidine kinase PilS (NtrC family)